MRSAPVSEDTEAIMKKFITVYRKATVLLNNYNIPVIYEYTMNK